MLPAVCNQTALSDSSRGAGEGLAEAHGAHACETRSEVVILLCGSIPSTQGHAYRPFAEHAGGGRRSVQSKRALPRTMSDFIVRTFGATQVAPVRIQHNTTYRRKNGTFTSERTLTRGSSASDRHAEDAPWISSPFIRSLPPVHWILVVRCRLLDVGTCSYFTRASNAREHSSHAPMPCVAMSGAFDKSNFCPFFLPQNA